MKFCDLLRGSQKQHRRHRRHSRIGFGAGAFLTLVRQGIAAKCATKALTTVLRER
jgi:hypothetical protein